MYTASTTYTFSTSLFQCLKCGWTVMHCVQPLLGPMQPGWPIDSQWNV